MGFRVMIVFLIVYFFDFSRTTITTTYDLYLYTSEKNCMKNKNAIYQKVPKKQCVFKGEYFDIFDCVPGFTETKQTYKRCTDQFCSINCTEFSGDCLLVDNLGVYANLRCDPSPKTILTWIMPILCIIGFMVLFIVCCKKHLPLCGTHVKIENKEE